MNEMQILWEAVKAAIWCKDSAKAWGASWCTFGLAELQREPWFGKLALLLGMAYTAIRIYREWLQIRAIKREESERKTAIPIVMIAILSMFLSGCGLMPKAVEYGQRKVQAVPEKREKQVEAEKQAAAYVAEQAQETLLAATAEQSSTNVLQPASEASVAAQALTQSLGAPSEPWKDDARLLALRLARLESKFDAAVREYRKDVAPDVGKKIEGTGWLKVPWLLNFTFYGCIVVAVFMTGRIALNLWNPAIGGVVGQVERVGIGVVTRGFSQVISGVESFKEKIDSLDLDDKAKAAIKGLLREKLTDNQDHDVQAAIKRLAN